MKTIAPRKCELTIKRPDGTIETFVDKIDYMTDGIWKQFNAAMQKAGRGVGVSYQNIEAVVEMEDSDYRGRCERCGEKIEDTRKAYSQMEWARFAGNKVRVKTCYCDGCREVLQAVGMGEVSAMEERAADVPSYEPTHKPEADA